MVRRKILLWHRWFGLLAAGWLFMLGSTGSILVFTNEIDRALNPDLMLASGSGTLPIRHLVDAAQAAMPGYQVTYLDLANEPGATVRASLIRNAIAASKAQAPQTFEAFIDPATGHILGVRNPEALDLSQRGIMSFIYRFHYSLHLGDWMVWLLGLVAFLWIVDHIAAVVIAFPSSAKWRESFRIRKAVGYKRTFDLHRAGGLWMFPVTLVLAVSGVYFNWPDTFRAVVNWASPVTQSEPEVRTPFPRPHISFDRAISSGAKANVDAIAYDAARGIYTLYVFDRRDIEKFGGRAITVNAQTGARISDFHSANGSAGDIIMAWQYPLHSGKAFGWPGRILIFLSGIMLCVFVVTGVQIWSRKQRAKSFSAKRELQRSGI